MDVRVYHPIHYKVYKKAFLKVLESKIILKCLNLGSKLIMISHDSEYWLQGGCNTAIRDDSNVFIE